MKKNRKHKWKYQINIKKKVLVLVILGVSLFVGLGYAIINSNLEIFGTLEVGKYDKTLYGVFQKEAIKGYAAKYTGSHQDSMDPTKSTEDIYHFYADTDAKGTDILNKNNVVFADYCWQMIRTTDTGGVKLLYNGIAEKTMVNGQYNYTCDNNRLHVMGSTLVNLSLRGTYSFAKAYTETINGGNSTFALVDDPDDPDDYKSIYIDYNTSEDVLVEISEKYPYMIVSGGVHKVKGIIKKNGLHLEIEAYRITEYDAIGVSIYNDDYSLSSVGYMYGDVYPVSSLNYNRSANLTSQKNFTSSFMPLRKGYYYASSIDWNNINENNYTLIDPQQITDETDYNTLVGKYIMSNTVGVRADYIMALSGTSNGYNIVLSNGNTDVYVAFSDGLTSAGELDDSVQIVELKDYYKNYSNYKGKYTCGNSNTVCDEPFFTVSTASRSFGYLSGEITLAKGYDGLNLTQYETISEIEWYNNYESYSDYKYTCGDASTTCTETNLKYIISRAATSYSYVKNYYFGESVVYEDNVYKLQNVVGLETTDDLNTLSTHHYVCTTIGQKECSSVAYVYYYEGLGSTMNYITLNDSNVTNVQDAVDGMLRKNTNDSRIKKGIDDWYTENLKDTVYEAKLDDTIFCNDRSFNQNENYLFEKSGWYDKGGLTNNMLYFKEGNNVTGSGNGNIIMSHPTQDLSCTNETDKFSVSNDKAKLLYKIGLLTASEYDITNQYYNSQVYYWFGSPSHVNGNGFYMHVIGDYSNNPRRIKSAVGASNTLEKVRPSISLIAGTKYSQGNGSMTNPYIVDMSN